MKTKLIVTHVGAPLARIPGFHIKENKAPYVPVAVVMMNDSASPKGKLRAREVAARMAAAPELYDAVKLSLRYVARLLEKTTRGPDYVALLVWQETLQCAKDWADVRHPDTAERWAKISKSDQL